MDWILDKLYEEQEIVEELIKIDNGVMNTDYNYNSYYEVFDSVLNEPFRRNIIDKDTVFVTEGDVYITLDLLKRMMVGANVVIFINQGFVGMNKWLISKYKEMTNSDMVILDTGINYNKYIDKGYRVVPIGEDAIINQVLEDFYG
jgi:hypothetical protein